MYPPVPIDSVRVFATGVPEAYTELAVPRTQRFLAHDAKVLAALRERASRMPRCAGRVCGKASFDFEEAR